MAKRYKIELRQSYLRMGKQALVWSQRYAHSPEGGEINAILAACGHNLRLILKSISFWPPKIYGFLSKLLEKLVELSSNRKNRVLKFA